MSRLTAIDSLCTRQETKIAAKELLQLAQTKTGPGSGFNMPYSNALPAVCAFIASERLQNNDVKRPEAQAASCLKPTDFVKCYKIVQSATKAEYDAQKGKKKEKEPTARISGRTSSNNFYDMFIINSAIPGPKSTIIEWVNRAEKLLSLDERVFDTSDVAAKHAVFLWVYKVVQTSHSDLGLNDYTKFASLNKIDMNNPTTIETLNYLDSLKTTIPLTIAEELRRVRLGGPAKSITTIVSPRKSPTKQPLREPPTKGSPQKKRILEVEDFPGPAPDTPSKKPKFAAASSSSSVTLDKIPASPRKAAGFATPFGSPKKSSLALAGATSPKKTVKFPDLASARTEPRTPQKNRQIAMDPSPTRRGHVLSLDAMDVDEEEPEEETQPTKRLRPVFRDHVQWTTRDPRVEALIRRGEAAKKKMIKKYGDPLAELRPNSTK